MRDWFSGARTRRAIEVACVGCMSVLGFSTAALGTDYTLNPSAPASSTNFTTINTALTGVPSGASASNPNRLIIYPGTYNIGTVSLQMSSSQHNIDYIGLTGNPNDVVITSALQSGSVNTATGGVGGGANGTVGTGGTSGSSTLVVKGVNIAFANVTIANSTDTPYLISHGLWAQSDPAVALQVNGADQTSFSNCSILGYQDALYLKGGRNYFNNCTISGDDDFIFGYSTAVFNGGTINIDGNHVGGCITAASTNTTSANGFVFMNNKITGNSVQNNSVIDPYGSAIATGAAANSFYLGRPWGYQQAGGDSVVDYINNIFDTSAIESAGWTLWTSGETDPGGDSRYAEYGNVQADGVTPVDTSGRVAWASHQLSASQAVQFTLNNIFSVGGSASTTPASGAFWYGAGFDGSSPADSWPQYFGLRDTANTAEGVTNPTAYTNPTWNAGSFSVASWDPTVQIATLAVPEPASIAVAGVAAGLLVSRRRRTVG
jgi:pectin methylesterase-like acyl-CoA thioesterase